MVLNGLSGLRGFLGCSWAALPPAGPSALPANCSRPSDEKFEGHQRSLTFQYSIFRHSEKIISSCKIL